jgi:probable phosphoglycerate mutase
MHTSEYGAGMINVFLVRHGEADASWSEALDPGLSGMGHAQAEAVAARLGHRPPFVIRSSPQRRARETAAPLAEALDLEVTIDHRFRELPSLVPVPERGDWLRDIMRTRWPEREPELLDWREQAWSALGTFVHDTVIFTHFMLINALLGRASGDDRLVVFDPDNGSISHLAVSSRGVEVIARGAERATAVL